ncbi:hypothetical protein A7N44_002530 [Salmonella enterica subsp. enterica serovar Waycross]|nr:hypothetical protein [Salmonella enterica subsp. enterica serovar Waycross]
MCIGIFLDLINIIKNNELIVGICSYYHHLNQVVTTFSFITIFSFSFSRTCLAWYRCL